MNGSPICMAQFFGESGTVPVKTYAAMQTATDTRAEKNPSETADQSGLRRPCALSACGDVGATDSGSGDAVGDRVDVVVLEAKFRRAEGRKMMRRSRSLSGILPG